MNREQMKQRETMALANVENAIDALMTALRATRYPGVISEIGVALVSARKASSIMQDLEDRN